MTEKELRKLVAAKLRANIKDVAWFWAWFGFFFGVAWENAPLDGEVTVVMSVIAAIYGYIGTTRVQHLTDLADGIESKPEREVEG